MSGTTVALIGFMGAGKSRIGMALAHRLRVPFVDTDGLIAEQMGPIEQIFAEQGEAVFRAVERDVVGRVLEKARDMASVVALGGGAVTSAEVRRALAGIPHVVWLTAPVEVLFSRAAEGGRPLAADEGTFRRLFEQRDRLYAEVARARVANAGDRTADEVVDEILVVCGISDVPAAASGAPA
jgi:shikimate kinase